MYFLSPTCKSIEEKPTEYATEDYNSFFIYKNDALQLLDTIECQYFQEKLERHMAAIRKHFPTIST